MTFICALLIGFAGGLVVGVVATVLTIVMFCACAVSARADDAEGDR